MISLNLGFDTIAIRCFKEMTYWRQIYWNVAVDRKKRLIFCVSKAPQHQVSSFDDAFPDIDKAEFVKALGFGA